MSSLLTSLSTWPFGFPFSPVALDDLASSFLSFPLGEAGTPFSLFLGYVLFPFPSGLGVRAKSGDLGLFLFLPHNVFFFFRQKADWLPSDSLPRSASALILFVSPFLVHLFFLCSPPGYHFLTCRPPPIISGMFRVVAPPFQLVWVSSPFGRQFVL